MYAIVRVGGKQYRVEKGDELLVDRMREDEGAKVALQPLLFRSDDAVFDADGLEKVKVEAVVKGHERGEKMRILKFKPKRGYKRRHGPPLRADRARDRRHQDALAQARREEEGGGGRGWLIRRDSAPAATVATHRLSASA